MPGAACQQYSLLGPWFFLLEITGFVVPNASTCLHSPHSQLGVPLAPCLDSVVV